MIDCEMVFSPSSSLGDTIVASPIARHFSKMCRRLHVPVSPWVIPTARELYKEDTNVVVVDYHNDTQLDNYIKHNNLIRLIGPPIFTVPCDSTFSCVLWDEQWYTHYDVPFGQRYSGFNLPAKSPNSEDLFKKLVTKERFILTHTQWTNHKTIPIDMHTWRKDSGLDDLDQFQIIDLTPELSSNLLDFVELISGAEEIHCVPSCVFCLVDSITNKTNARLFYHDIRKNTMMRVNHRWNNHRWCMISYQNKIL